MSDSALTRLAHLFALSAFAVAAPLFEMLRRYPEFLAVHGAGGADLLAIAMLSLLPLPFVLWTMESVAGRLRPSLLGPVHAGLVGFLTALITLPPFGRIDWLPGPLPVALAIGVGVAGAIVFVRFRVLRELLLWGAAAAPAFALIFALDPSIRRIAFAEAVAVESSAWPSDTPIVLVVFDALPTVSLLDRNLQIDALRYPNFAEFASHSTWYRQNTTVGYGTLACVSAIFDGRYPANDRHAILADHPQNIFTLTFDSHRQHVLEPLTRLSPERREGDRYFLAKVSRAELLRDTGVILAQLLTPPASRDRLPALDQTWKHFADPSRKHDIEARRKVEAFHAYLDEMRVAEKATLYAIHTVLPHGPFRYFPSGRTYSIEGDDPSGAANWGDWKGMEWAILHNQQRHLLQLAYVDSLLGELLNRLKQLGIYDEALVVLTADHGVGFVVGEQRRGLGDNNRLEVLGVPLLIKRPGQVVGNQSDLPTESIDILPTIAEIAGLSLQAPVDGVSLVGNAAASRTIKRQTYRSPTEFSIDVLSPFKEIVARNFERFGDGADDRLWVFGPNSDLVGRRIEEFELGSATDCRVVLRDADRFDAVDLLSEPLPCELYGELYPEGGSQVRALAIALNGEIVATTQNYRTKENKPRTLWSALLPESALRAGKNDLKIYLIGADARGERMLSPV
jgi:hypothetical protein